MSLSSLLIQRYLCLLFLFLSTYLSPLLSSSSVGVEAFLFGNHHNPSTEHTNKKETTTSSQRASRIAPLNLLYKSPGTVESTINGSAEQPKHSNETADDIPGVPFLVEWIGKEMYKVLNRKKYKFILYMTVGKLPDEATAIVFLNYVCNLLYSLCILMGFLLLPRGPMLMATILTLFVGPALVLILLGCLLVTLSAFALYPVASVLVLWLFFFFTSHLAQVLGRKLGLDHDGDGDVDMLDILSYAAATKWGKMIGIPALHKMLNDTSMDPFQEIHRRLDEIQQIGATTTRNQTRTSNNGPEEWTTKEGAEKQS